MPNNKIQSLTVNGVTYDIVDNTSGYINAQYIENKTDYSIPVSRVGEIVVGETAIGTDSTNFPTSKAVVDYVDERVVQEMDAIDVGVTSVNGKTGSVTLSASDIGAATISQIPTSTSQLTNDSGFITSDSDEKLAVSRNLDNGRVYDVVLGSSSDPINTETKFQSKTFQYSLFNNTASLSIGKNSARGELRLYGPQSNYSTRIRSTTTADNNTIYLSDKEGTIALTSDIPTVPTNVSAFTNDAGYLTASDIASVMTYKGTKANYTALPASGNTTGDVWHLTDTGAEWAWDGSAWQELGTAIDLSNYATKATTLAGYGITDAKIQNGTITLGSNSITPLTSFTETDPTVPSWAKASSKPSYALSELTGAADVQAIEGLTGTSGFLKKTAADTWTLDTSTYLTSYTETDPVFSASAAAGITATDISNWNAKVSDDKTWNGVTFSNNTTTTSDNANGYVPFFETSSSTTTKLIQMVSNQTGANAAYKLARYNSSGYLISTTPSANDNSTKVATTAYVDAAIPKVYSSTNIGGYLTMATLPIYDGTVV